MVMNILNIYWGDPNNLSMEMFIMKMIGGREVAFANHDVIRMKA
jgi:hypothetical protein